MIAPLYTGGGWSQEEVEPIEPPTVGEAPKTEVSFNSAPNLASYRRVSAVPTKSTQNFFNKDQTLATETTSDVANTTTSITQNTTTTTTTTDTTDASPSVPLPNYSQEVGQNALQPKPPLLSLQTPVKKIPSQIPRHPTAQISKPVQDTQTPTMPHKQLPTQLPKTPPTTVRTSQATSQTMNTPSQNATQVSRITKQIPKQIPPMKPQPSAPTQSQQQVPLPPLTPQNSQQPDQPQASQQNLIASQPQVASQTNIMPRWKPLPKQTPLQRPLIQTPSSSQTTLTSAPHSGSPLLVRHNQTSQPHFASQSTPVSPLLPKITAQQPNISPPKIASQQLNTEKPYEPLEQRDQEEKHDVEEMDQESGPSTNPELPQTPKQKSSATTTTTPATSRLNSKFRTPTPSNKTRITNKVCDVHA